MLAQASEIFGFACPAIIIPQSSLRKNLQMCIRDRMDGVLLITADHGNADKMVAEDGEPFTAHTTNPVPFCVVGYDCKLREGGRLANIAPTMLKILNVPQPKEMTGESIIQG